MKKKLLIRIGNKEMSLDDAFDFCNGGLFCSSSLVNDESSLLEYKEFSSKNAFLKQLEEDASTTWRTSMSYYEQDVYIKGAM